MGRQFEVRDSVLSLRGAAHYEGAPLTEAELEGIDVGRLLRIGSIVEVDGIPGEGVGERESGRGGEPRTSNLEPRTSGEGDSVGAEELALLTKAQIYDLAIKAGVEPDGLKKLRKDDLIQFVLDAYQVAAEAEQSLVASEQSPVISD